MAPRPPWFRARSLALARFGVGCHIVPVDRLLRCPFTCPDLGRFFSCRAAQPIGFPLGKLSPEVTDEGATGSAQRSNRKTSLRRRPGEPSFSKERLGTGSPLIRPGFAHLPQGEGFGVEAQRVETFFHKMLFQHIFPENASQIGVRISDEIVPRPHQKQPPQKPASENERLSNPGSRAEPWCSFPRLSSKESRAPARGRAGNGALRPKGGFGAAHPKGTQAGYAARAHSPALAPQGCSSSWACWR